MAKSNVLAYMKKRKIPVLDKNKVVVRVDEGCDMAEVEVNGGCVMMGNFWDFRPEVHGIKLAFASHDSLAEVIVLGLKAEGKEVVLERDDNWEYQD